VTIGVLALIETGKEKSIPHVNQMHSNLTITLDNRPIAMPSQIGLDNPLCNGHNLDKYWTQKCQCPEGCSSKMNEIF
jgi:hypothetical protein